VVTSYMDISSDVAHAIVVMSYMETSCDIARYCGDVISRYAI
jgi:hypothetical protein